MPPIFSQWDTRGRGPSRLINRLRHREEAPDRVGEVGLAELVGQAQPVLYRVSTIFPFVLFPDHVIVRINHVDVVRGTFFGSSSNIRVMIADIKQVIVNYIPFFASLEIIPTGPLEQLVNVTHLPVGRARRAKRIIVGLMESYVQKVDMSKYDAEEIADAMEEIGTARE